ncbi:MAG: thymidine phosphorylase [Candidatus Roizmanbacteria bacterium]|nr:thymidine phosphorylase [Candidatus Roizmanbacteria bacterium]
MSQHNEAIAIIKKKLEGKSLTYSEVFTLMDEIGNKRLGPIPTSYFAAAGFQSGFSKDELYYLTKAMVETGKQLHFKGIVADKHSTGGVAGTRTTMIIVPIIAAAGYKIPKNSSRAITSAAGTADTMELLAKVTFSVSEIEKIVEKVGGCIVWGGHLGIAPADDIIIQVEEPMMFESYDKIIVSIMAKKVASCATHLVLDIPVGPYMKIKHFKDADLIAKKFKELGKRFDMKMTIDINETLDPSGRGVGPALEVIDVLKVLEQTEDRPMKLEAKALRLSGRLLDLIFKDDPSRKGQSGEEVAKEMLTTGKALTKMKEIIKAQKGDPDISSNKIKTGKYEVEIKADRSGKITAVENKQINTIARLLGSPNDKYAGIRLRRRLYEHVKKGEVLFTLYSSDNWRAEEAKHTVKHMTVYKIS